jgi:gluconate 5-dehydrogenase
MTTSLFDLTGKVALVTGSTSGLGEAIAGGLGAAGATIVVNGRNEERLDKTVADFKARGLTAVGYAFNVTDETAVLDAVARIESEVGPIDILVNNAGIQRRQPLTEMSTEVFEEVIKTNLTSLFIVGRAVARRMIPRKRGKIINIASLASEVARPTIGPYTAAKGGVRQLTKTMCVEWAEHNVQANAIGPGYFRTELNRALWSDEKFNEWVTARTPAARWGEPEELIGVAVFLSSAASDFMNGQTVYVDGGLLASM